jgi:hypothetical protein
MPVTLQLERDKKVLTRCQRQENRPPTNIALGIFGNPYHLQHHTAQLSDRLREV